MLEDLLYRFSQNKKSKMLDLLNYYTPSYKKYHLCISKLVTELIKDKKYKNSLLEKMITEDRLELYSPYLHNLTLYIAKFIAVPQEQEDFFHNLYEGYHNYFNLFDILYCIIVLKRSKNINNNNKLFALILALEEQIKKVMSQIEIIVDDEAYFQLQKYEEKIKTAYVRMIEKNKKFDQKTSTQSVEEIKANIKTMFALLIKKHPIIEQKKHEKSNQYFEEEKNVEKVAQKNSQKLKEELEMPQFTKDKYSLGYFDPATKYGYIIDNNLGKKLNLDLAVKFMNKGVVASKGQHGIKLDTNPYCAHIKMGTDDVAFTKKYYQSKNNKKIFVFDGIWKHNNEYPNCLKIEVSDEQMEQLINEIKIIPLGDNID
jgi:hypothetical protein